MSIVVGVVFKEAGKIYYFDPAGLNLKTGNNVIVKTSRGMEFGEVVMAPEDVPDEEIVSPLKKVQRIASASDKEKVAKNRLKEEEASKIAEKEIAKHKLQMKLVDVEYVFDGSRIIFYFTADTRVDFRELVKDLASRFKTRIELRQIGVRDEAKMIGGLGPCGRRLCCTLFLSDFEPVSIKMAKEQDLPLNPLKISGVCGRLMCCLKYEYEVYHEFRKKAPEREAEVETPEGSGKVVGYNVPRCKVMVEIAEGKTIEALLEEIKVLRKAPKVKKEKKGKAEEKQAKKEKEAEDVKEAEDQEDIKKPEKS